MTERRLPLARELLVWSAAGLLLSLLALARPVDHDESQYVAAAVLTAAGLLPYRDFAYLQAPLQPFLFAPLAWAAGAAAWPALRVANALLGAVALWCVWRAARLVSPARVAAIATALFACCDTFLFAIGTARNDALPAACLAGALWLAVRAERGLGRRGQAAAGLLLASAAAAKVSYALPALAYGGWALLHLRHRPGMLALGAAPVAAFVAWTALIAPAGFWFGVVTFPLDAPADWYAGRPWKLSTVAKLVDVLKFLALGPALLALVYAVRRPGPVTALALAGLLAAALPTPTWRQYLLPLLPPLFVLLAQRWAERPPGRALGTLFAVFAAAGLAPTVLALASGPPAMLATWRDGRRLAAAMDQAGVRGPVATLSPQVLPQTGRAPDPRFAAGPFVFRSRIPVPPGLPIVQWGRLATAPLPEAVLVGGEGRWSSGDARLDASLEREAIWRGYNRLKVIGTRWRLWQRR